VHEQRRQRLVAVGNLNRLDLRPVDHPRRVGKGLHGFLVDCRRIEPEGVRTLVESNRHFLSSIRTLAGAGINDARYMFAFQQRHSPLGRGVSLEDLGGSGLYLLSDLSGGVTGEIHFVDSGYNIIAMPQPDALRGESGESKDAAQ